MEGYLRSREEDALEVLSTARTSPTARVVSGIEACWRAASEGRPAMLVVEEGYYVPADLGPRGPVPAEGRSGARDPGSDRLHDLVDDLIETVIVRGGWVAFARDGTLSGDRRVALVLAAQRAEAGAGA
jgi:hypothetical protein